MNHPVSTRIALLLVPLASAAAFAWLARAQPTPPPPMPAIVTVPGMPPVPDAKNLYSEATAGRMSPTVAGDLARVYVPNLQSNDVYVIDPATFKVVDKFKVGVNPQHVVPSWDLHTLLVANNAENRTDGSLTPVDPKTGKPGKPHSGRRSVQHVFFAGRQVGDRRRRSAEAPRLSRSAHDGAAVLARDAALRRHQSRRLFDRRPLRDLHLRIHRHRRQDRPCRAQGDWGTCS